MYCSRHDYLLTLCAFSHLILTNPSEGLLSQFNEWGNYGSERSRQLIKIKESQLVAVFSITKLPLSPPPDRDSKICRDEIPEVQPRIYEKLLSSQEFLQFYIRLFL